MARQFVAWRGTGSHVLWVSHRPGQGGKDWGYDPDPGKAQMLTETMAKRFVNYMRSLGSKGHIREV